ncbi:helix-turn-helix transcriptional regulator [Streptomyces sp. NPDC049687]|uniref:helix-turn-helix transcriptional regulator n=1 Tax=Streptomyces sp. NPDC049687 TaxID=3365596 RepID=UPI0037B250F0
MTPAPHARHGVEELCTEGARLYERALRDGRLTAADAEPAPCLLDFGLLHPAVDDPGLLEPVPPVLALHRLLRTTGDRIAAERRREDRLLGVFEPFLRLDESRATASDTPAVTLLSGMPLINAAITRAMADARRELLCVQPRTSHVGPPPSVHLEAIARDQAFLDRGGRIRTLYQHTLRHAPTVLARYERLRGDVQARTLDEVTDRLILVDHAVAFLPANKERTLALEVRQPALIEYFATTFDHLWRLAVPMHPQAVRQPSLNGVTPRQRAIATLLVEGHTDAVIAARLGMNIRTARVHIAKLAATLGSDSRAQLGYLIARSGILEQERDPT